MLTLRLAAGLAALLLTASAATAAVERYAEDSAEDASAVMPPVEEGFRTGEDVDHCVHYRRLFLLARRAETHLARMDAQASRTLRRLIDEILMEAGMETFGSLLELHDVCRKRQPPAHH